MTAPVRPQPPEGHLRSVLHLHGVGAISAPPAALVGVLALGVLVLGVGALVQQTVVLDVDGETRRLTTPHRSPDAQLRDLGIVLQDGDRLDVSNSLMVRRATPIVVEADSRTIELRAVVDRPAEAAMAAGVHLDPYDRVVPVEPPRTPLFLTANAETALAEIPRGLPRLTSGDQSERYRVMRAVPVTVHDGGLSHVVWTTGATLGEAVVSGGFELVAADSLSPPAATPVQAGMHIWIQRSKPVSFEVDGRTLQTRTRATSVGALLAQEGIAIEPGDRVEPGLRAPLDGTPIRVVRVRDETITFQEAVAFDVVYRDVDTLPLGTSRTIEEGIAGVRKWTTRIVYEDGREINRQLVRSWIETPAKPRIVGRGTQLVYADVSTEAGEATTYWAKVRVYVTAYNATSAGKPKGSPGFGITSTGKKATRGIIAVDPKYIPYGTRMYVPGYGLGVAEDTGGGLHGAHIDVCFDDDEPMTWATRYIDIYLLTPAPPIDKIRHLVPVE